MYKIPIKFTSTASPHHMKGGGEAYTIVLLGLVAAASYLITGGLLPNLDKNPVDPEHVQIADTTAVSDKTNLQLVNIGIKPTETPEVPETPTPTDEPTPTTGPGTPTPTPKPTKTPTPTPEQVACFNKAAVALVVDISGSMATVDPGSTKSRLARLKDALDTFIGNFKNDSAISLITFAGGGKVVVPFAKKSENGAALTSAIAAMTSGGSTNMKNGLDDAKNQLADARDAYPNYNFYTVFFTDGVPENGSCKYRNHTGTYHYYQDNDQDICVLAGTNTEPTFFTHVWSPIEPATQIKDEGTKIFSVAMFQPSSDPAETQKNDKAEALMEAVASNPDSTYYLSSPTNTSLTSAYKKIASRICL